MATMLTAEEVAFLAAYKLTPTDVFDGTAYRSGDAKERAKAAGKDLMLGSRCREAGHRLRTRAGHCVQCDPKKLAFQRRHTITAFVYVLGSRKTRLFKVGSTDDVMRRIDQHNRQGYGGASDWQRIWHMRVDDSGRVEVDIQKRLARYAVEGSYVKDGAEQGARELFRAPLMRVMTAVADVIGTTVNEGDLWSGYEAYLWE